MFLSSDALPETVRGTTLFQSHVAYNTILVWLYYIDEPYKLFCEVVDIVIPMYMHAYRIYPVLPKLNTSLEFSHNL